MSPFSDSTDLLIDPDALKARFGRDGYVYLKGAVDSDLISVLREQIISIMRQMNWLWSGTDAAPLTPITGPFVEEEAEYFRVYDEVQKLEAFHRLPHHDSVLSPLKSLLGDTAFPHPLSIARLVFPDNTEGATPPHQDYPNNQGSENLYAAWIPLGDCPMRLGSLNVLKGSHKLGLLPVSHSVGAGNRQAELDERHSALQWVGGDFTAGDMLVFHSLTVHRSLPNTTDRMRLSVDYRFQREREALTENCLQPHFRRLTWSQIYADWPDRELAYYWKKKHYRLVDWNPALHDIPEQSVDAAVREKIMYDRRRRQKHSRMKDQS